MFRRKTKFIEDLKTITVFSNEALILEKDDLKILMKSEIKGTFIVMQTGGVVNLER